MGLEPGSLRENSAEWLREAPFKSRVPFFVLYCGEGL